MSGNSITEGDLLGPMVRLAAPLIAIQLLQISYNLADAFWLGRLSTDAVGAVSIVVPLLLLLIAVAGGFATAGSILVSQHKGADQPDAVDRITGQTLTLIAVVSVGLALVGVATVESIVGLFPGQAGTAETVIPLAVDYLRVLFLGLPFLFGFLTFNTIMRGYGDTYTPMKVMIVSVVLNVSLDPVLIFGVGPIPSFGIEGAAVATITARGVATAMGLYVLFVTSKGPDVVPSHLVPRRADTRHIVRHGLPLAAERSGSQLGLVIQAAIVVTFAPAVVTAWGIGNRIISIVFLFAMGLSLATNTMVGQNLGASKADRAERAVKLAVAVGAGLMIAVAAFVFLLARPILEFFIATGTEEAAATIDHGVEYLRISALAFVFIAVVDILLGAFRGAGNTRTALVFTLVKIWVLNLGSIVVLVFVFEVGPVGVWVAIVVEYVVGTILVSAWYARGTWKSAVIDGEADATRSSPGPDGDAGGRSPAGGSADP